MKTPIGVLVLCAVLCVFLAGCGTLKLPAITNRDLTPSEYQAYQEEGDGFKLVFVPPLFCYGKFLGAGEIAGERSSVTTFKFKGALNLPVPILGFGYTSASAAFFDDEGKRVGRFGGGAFAPLFGRMYFDVKDPQTGKWQKVVRYYSVLRFFGFGTAGGKSMSKVFVNLGEVTEEEIKQGLPGGGMAP